MRIKIQAQKFLFYFINKYLTACRFSGIGKMLFEIWNKRKGKLAAVPQSLCCHDSFIGRKQWQWVQTYTFLLSLNGYFQMACQTLSLFSTMDSGPLTRHNHIKRVKDHIKMKNSFKRETCKTVASSMWQKHQTTIATIKYNKNTFKRQHYLNIFEATAAVTKRQRSQVWSWPGGYSSTTEQACFASLWFDRRYLELKPFLRTKIMTVMLCTQCEVRPSHMYVWDIWI